MSGGLLRASTPHYACVTRLEPQFIREMFQKAGITYRVSDKSKSEIYIDLLALLNSRRVSLLDHKKLLAQLCALERRVGRSQRDSVDHAPNAHDDIINAAAGSMVKANFEPQAIKIVVPIIVGTRRHDPFNETSLVEAQARAYRDARSFGFSIERG
jgi:hypothetical protein